MPSSTRRDFMKSSAAAAGAAVLAAPAIAKSAQSPNDRIRIGLVGIGGRMRFHIGSLSTIAQEGNVEIAAICDCDQTKLDHAMKVYPQLSENKPAVYNDQRRLFDDKSIDAVSFATQDHWHALQTIWACQAGKDVYIEKPLSHNIWEGRKMVEAARRYQCMV